MLEIAISKCIFQAKKIKQLLGNQNGRSWSESIPQEDIYQRCHFKDNLMKLFWIAGSMEKKVGENLYGENIGKIMMI